MSRGFYWMDETEAIEPYNKPVNYPVVRDPDREKIKIYNQALYLLRHDCKCGFSFFIMEIPHIDFKPCCPYCRKKENLYVGFIEIE